MKIMANYEKLLLQAGAAAPVIVEEPNGIIAVEGRPPVQQGPINDDDPVHLKFEPTKSQIPIKSFGDYTKLIETGVEALGWSAILPGVRRDHMTHETRHLEAARALGIRAGILTFNVYNIRRRDGTRSFAYNLSVGFPDCRTTRLGAAIILAYPEQPSIDDHRQYQALGYKTRRDVIMKARARGLIVPR